MFTAVVRVSGTGRLDDFRERVRWLMVRDEDAEDYTEHHGKGTLEYRFQPRRGIPFPAFTAASADYPELRVEAEWERDGERGRALIENGQLVETSATRLAEAQLEVAVGDDGRLDLALACIRGEDGAIAGYVATAERHTYFRYKDSVLTLVNPEEPDAKLEEAALRFAGEWIWYDEEDAVLERARYANYGFPVRGANLKSDKLALLRANAGRYSTLDENAKAACEAIAEQWLKR
ncbi:MAG TPA: hypothetical protein VFZ94_12585 [Burkholderiales bacterium]